MMHVFVLDFNGTITRGETDPYTMLINSGIPLEHQYAIVGTRQFQAFLRACPVAGWALDRSPMKSEILEPQAQAWIVTGCQFPIVVEKYVRAVFGHTLHLGGITHVPFNGEADYIARKAHAIENLVDQCEGLYHEMDVTVVEDSRAVLDWLREGNAWRMMLVTPDGAVDDYERVLAREERFEAERDRQAAIPGQEPPGEEEQ